MKFCQFVASVYALYIKLMLKQVILI